MDYTIENTSNEPISFVYWKTGMKQTLQPGEFVKVTTQSEEQLNYYKEQMKEFQEEAPFDGMILPNVIPLDGQCTPTISELFITRVNEAIDFYEAEDYDSRSVGAGVKQGDRKYSNLNMYAENSWTDDVTGDKYYQLDVYDDEETIWVVFEYTESKGVTKVIWQNSLGLKIEPVTMEIPYQLELNTTYNFDEIMDITDFGYFADFIGAATIAISSDYIILKQGDNRFNLYYSYTTVPLDDFEVIKYLEVYNANKSIYCKIDFTDYNPNTFVVLGENGLHLKEFIPSDTTTVDFGTRNIANINNVLFNLVYNDGTYTSKIFDVNKPFSEFYNPVEPYKTLSSAQLDNNAIEHIAEEPVLKHYTFNLYDANNNLLYSQGSGSFRQINISLNSLPEHVRQLFDDYYSPSLNYYFAVNYDERAEEEGLGGLYLIAEHSLD